MVAVMDLPARLASPVAISLAFQGMGSNISPQHCCASADAFELKAASSTAFGSCPSVQPHQQASKRPGSSEVEADSSPLIFLGAPQCTFAYRIPPEPSPLQGCQGKEAHAQAEPGTAQHPAVSQKSVDVQLPHVAVDLGVEICLHLAVIIQELRRLLSSAPQSSKRAGPECPSSPDDKSSRSADVKSSKSLSSSTTRMSLQVVSLTGQLLHGPALEHSAQMDGSSSSDSGLAFWANHLEVNMQTTGLKVCSPLSPFPT